MLAEHVLMSPAPAKVQVPLGVKVTVPVGVVGLALVSATVTVHVEAWFTSTGLSQLIPVEVEAFTEGGATLTV